MSKDEDGYERFIRDKMDAYLSGTHGDDGIKISFVDIDDHIVCVVDVDPSPMPVYFVKSDVDQTFYVRRGGSTKPRAGIDALQYIRRRFPLAIANEE